MSSAPGTIAPSLVEHFETHTASIPDVIAAEGEILPPGQAPALETGWAVADLREAFSFTFFFLSKRLGDQWELDDDEAERFAKVWKPIFDRYLPMEESEWVAPILVTAAIVGSRAIATDWSKGKDSKAAKASTATPASTESKSSSANGGVESPPVWEPFADSRAV